MVMYLRRQGGMGKQLRQRRPGSDRSPSLSAAFHPEVVPKSVVKMAPLTSKCINPSDQISDHGFLSVVKM